MAIRHCTKCIPIDLERTLLPDSVEWIVPKGIYNTYDEASMMISQYPFLQRIVIEENCFEKVRSFVIDSLSELESFMVGENCCMCKSCGTSNRKGEQIGGVLRIVNCPKLKSITVSLTAFFYYDSFVLKNLPSLQSIEIGFCSLGFSSFSLTGKTWIE